MAWKIWNDPTFDGSTYRIVIAGPAPAFIPHPDEDRDVHNPHAGKIVDGDGNPFNIRSFERNVDDPRNEGLDHEEIVASLKAEAAEQIRLEEATDVAEPDVMVFPGAGESL